MRLQIFIAFIFLLYPLQAMAAVAYRGNATGFAQVVVRSPQTSSTTCTMGSGTSSSDLVVTFLIVNDNINNFPWATLTPPGGITLITGPFFVYSTSAAPGTSGGNNQIGVAWLYWSTGNTSASTQAFSWTATGGNTQSSVCTTMDFTGANTSSPTFTTTLNSANETRTTAFLANAITPTDTGGLIMALGAIEQNAAGAATGGTAGWTIQTQGSTTNVQPSWLIATDNTGGSSGVSSGTFGATLASAQFWVTTMLEIPPLATLSGAKVTMVIGQ